MFLETLILDNILAFVLCFIGIAIFLEERYMNKDNRAWREFPERVKQLALVQERIGKNGNLWLEALDKCLPSTTPQDVTAIVDRYTVPCDVCGAKFGEPCDAGLHS